MSGPSTTVSVGANVTVFAAFGGPAVGLGLLLNSEVTCHLMPWRHIGF
jgi:hypothetical protein